MSFRTYKFIMRLDLQNGLKDAYMQGEGSQRQRISVADAQNTKGSRGSNPRNAHGIRLRPVSQLRMYQYSIAFEVLILILMLLIIS